MTVAEATVAILSMILIGLLHSRQVMTLVSSPAHMHLPARSGLVNKVEFLGLIPHK